MERVVKGRTGSRGVRVCHASLIGEAHDRDYPQYPFMIFSRAPHIGT